MSTLGSLVEVLVVGSVELVKSEWVGKRRAKTRELFRLFLRVEVTELTHPKRSCKRDCERRRGERSIRVREQCR